MTLGSLFDGIGGWLVAAVHSNIKPIWSSEIEKFCLAVTKKHFPEVVQLGDICKIDGGKIEPVEIICAGSPCQDLSIAGKRGGLNGERSGLFFRAVDIVRQMRIASDGKFPKYFVWENVTGAISSNGGLDFKTVLEEIAESEIPMPKSGKWAKAGLVRGGKCEIAWRVLDAQYFGVPQRRKRIFLVADFTGNRAAKILFECESVSRNIEESGGERKRNSARTENGVDESKLMLSENHGEDCRYKRLEKVSETVQSFYGTGGNNMPIGTLNARDYKGVGTQYFNEGKVQVVGGGVRRLTPLECERLQGLPDNYTLIDDKSCSDSARYKAIGNGMAQPVADWILKRIAEELRK